MDNIAQWLAYFLPDPAALNSIPSVPEFFKEDKLSMLLRLINSTSKGKVDSGLKSHLLLAFEKLVVQKFLCVLK